MRIALAQLNSTVGDLKGNVERILTVAREASRRGADLMLTPEMSLTGYPLDDLARRPDLYRQVRAALEHVRAATGELAVAVGHPEQDRGRLYNALSLLAGGRCLLRYRKRALANYCVFDECRQFRPGRRAGIAELAGIRLGFSICEDIWWPAPARQLQAAGAELLLNMSASPFHAEVHEERHRTLRRRVTETGLPVAYVNRVGGQDELVFDGGSLALDRSGELRLLAPQFTEGLYLLEYDPDSKELRAVAPEPIASTQEKTARTWQALVSGLHDYIDKSGSSGVVLGLSGGIDSAVTACLAVDALGPERVTALCMPSRHTAAISVTDANCLAKHLGIRMYTTPIDSLYEAFAKALEPALGKIPGSLAGENLQARCRAVLLMAHANRTNSLLLCTGNKSESATGYTTVYGDAAGAYAPLKDVYKTGVYALARWRNRQEPGGELIPARVLERPPSAELAPDQLDQDTLPDYQDLDSILEGLLEKDLSPTSLAREGADIETARRVLNMVRLSEHKRRQSPPGPRITRRSLGRDRRYPICSAYTEP